MSWVRRLSSAVLIALGVYALVMGVWSTTLKCLDLSSHDVQRNWDALERFAPSNGVAYALIALAAAAILGLGWTRTASGANPGNPTQ